MRQQRSIACAASLRPHTLSTKRTATHSEKVKRKSFKVSTAWDGAPLNHHINRLNRFCRTTYFDRSFLICITYRDTNNIWLVATSGVLLAAVSTFVAIRIKMPSHASSKSLSASSPVT